MDNYEDKFIIEETSACVANTKRQELVKQIESLKSFYYDIGFDSDNIKTIFSLTLSYLKGHVNKLVVKSFFDVMMNQSKLNTEKEIDLLNCFDDLVEGMDETSLVDSSNSVKSYLEAA